MKKKLIFQSDDEKEKFKALINESNCDRIKFFAPFQIVIILYELLKDIKNFIFNQEELENHISVSIFNINLCYHEIFGIIEFFIIVISIVIFVLAFVYKKNPCKNGIFFHNSVIIYGSFLLFSSVLTILVDAYAFHTADLTFFYFETLVVSALFYLPPAVVIPELLISNGILWALISVFNWDSVFSPYKPYCAFLLLGFCSSTIFRANYRLQALRNEEKIKKMQEEAEHRDKLKSMFLANMSHEIRTPMNAIVGMSELALDYQLNDVEKNNLRQIHSSALSLLAIINDILDFSKIESGKMEICNVDFDLLKTVYDVSNVAKVKIAGKPIQLVVEMDPNLSVFFNGDDLRLKQILINLTGNAAKFTEKGWIILRVENLKNYDSKEGLRFSVIDSGQGIKDEDLKKLFNAFQQVDMKANRTKEGTGLGLSISKNLVQLMGGNIGVKSEYQKGSCFYFNLPFKASAEEKCGQKYKAIFDKSEINKYHPELRNLPVDSLLNNGEFACLFAEKSEEKPFICPEAKILVVDDNETNLMIAKGLLNKFGVNPETAASGFDALEIAKRSDFDLIFMDHQMPVMDGIETLQKLLEQNKTEGKNPVVIALSANAVNGAAEMFLENGFDDFLAKPVQGKDFGRCLKKWLKPELIKAPGTENYVLSENKLSVPSDFTKPDGEKIDLKSALDFSGGFENWLSAAKTFYNGIKSKSADIEKFASEKDFNNFTIAVHALKSSAKVIGALELSEKAKELESLGKAVQEKSSVMTEGEILLKTDSLLVLYRSYLEILKEAVFYKKEMQVQKASESEIKMVLETLKGAARDNNLTLAEDCVKKLSGMELGTDLETGTDLKTLLPQLQEAVETINFEKLNELL